MLEQPPAGVAERRRTGEDRILTVPNALSVARLACIPLFLYLLFGRDDRFEAALLLGFLGATDCVDGYIARHFDQVSRLGKVLDPAADRVLLGVGVVAILVDGSVPMAVAVALIAREALVALAALVLAALGASRIDVTWVGKAGTFCNMVAFPFFLAGHDRALSWRELALGAGWAFAVPGFLLSWYAALTYLPLARNALREGRRPRALEEP
ncbi:MAG TPA: CDP-alcohol phosphatidyltransferase family protein [Gemmatimonadales bacterium]|nr:CDP-alcohol phosphatidyltransferase family protein [Gemmatimonadales bacterium]